MIAPTTVNHDTMFAVAGFAAVLLAAFLVPLMVSTRKRRRAGLWICLAVAAAPLILLFDVVAGQHGL
jgi:MFS-type transporter involved in bile tolerance (Atg22 family)